MRGAEAGRAGGASDASDANPYRAVADGTRRRILDLLADEERSVNELLERFEDEALSQPALSQHLKVLREAGLVLPVLIECDTGGERCGVQTPAGAVELARQVAGLRGLRFEGFSAALPVAPHESLLTQ